MWGKDLEDITEDITPNVTRTSSDSLKYIPRDKVNMLRLRDLGCDAGAILIRDEYRLAVGRLKDRRANIGGAVVTGQPGIGAGSVT